MRTAAVAALPGLVLSGLLVLAPAARAWEPGDPAAVAARVAEVREALKGKDPASAAQEKLARAKQPKPAWVAKSSFKVEGGGKTLLLGVGLQGAIPDPFGTTVMAEGKARANLLTLKAGTTTVQQPGPGRLQVSTKGNSKADPIDWWLGPDNTFYALVAEEAAEPADAATAAPGAVPAAPAAAPPAAAPK